MRNKNYSHIFDTEIMIMKISITTPGLGTYLFVCISPSFGAFNGMRNIILEVMCGQSGTSSMISVIDAA